MCERHFHVGKLGPPFFPLSPEFGAGQQATPSISRSRASEAQYALLTGEKPVFVKAAYNNAKNESGDKFSVTSEARQVAILGAFGLFPESCRAALEALGLPVTAAGATADDVAAASIAFLSQVTKPQRPRGRVIVATGHRVDARGREKPRFPNTPDAIARAALST